jgi:hypothetical protein
VLEGNPFTFPEVKTLLDGVTIGGRRILDKQTFTDIHSLVAVDEALEWGRFRGEGKEIDYTPDVGLGEYGRYTPLATVRDAPALNHVFTTGLKTLEDHVKQSFEKASAFLLFGALQHFFSTAIIVHLVS